MSRAWYKLLPGFLRARIEGRATVQKVLENTGWLFADKVVRMGIGLFVGVWVARYLGPDQFGLFNYAAAFVALFATVASLGLDGIVVRDIVRDPLQSKYILGTAIILRFIGSVFVFFLTVVAIAYIRPHDAITRWIVAIISAGSMFQSFDIIDLWFQSQVQSRYTVYAKNIAFILIAIVKVLLILAKAPLIAFAWAGLSEIALGAIGLLLAFHSQNAALIKWKWNAEWARRLLQDSWPLILSGMMISVYVKIDQIMLGNMVGDRQVGIYAAAVKISEVWYFIPTVISSSVYPALIKAHHVSEVFFYKKLKMIMGFFFWGSLFLSLIITSYSSEIVSFLYGSKYSESVPVLTIHIYSGIIVSMSIIFSQKFIIDGTTKIGFYGAFFGAISNVILNLWLIKDYGAKGAAIATVVSYTLPIVFQTLFFDRKIGLIFIESIFSIRSAWGNTTEKHQ